MPLTQTLSRAAQRPRSARMRALVRDREGVRLAHLPRPRVAQPRDVLIRVVAAGLCRTDLYVARGLLAARTPVVLGHEFSGVVEEVGSEVARVRAGDRVGVIPWVPCTECSECLRVGAEPRALRCTHAAMLGVDRDGAFAEFLLVPEECIIALPTGLPPLVAAYLEPVAASLAVLKADIRPGQRGLLLGENRIAELTRRVLAAHDFDSLEVWNEHQPEPEPGAYDFAIETHATPGVLDAMMQALKRGGVAVLKSRPAKTVSLDVRRAVLRELRFHAVNYGGFDDAVRLLASGRLELDGLLGPVFALEEYEALFAHAERDETAKPFFSSNSAEAPTTAD